MTMPTIPEKDRLWADDNSYKVVSMLTLVGLGLFTLIYNLVK
jgi:hypothetical protein